MSIVRQRKASLRKAACARVLCIRAAVACSNRSILYMYKFCARVRVLGTRGVSTLRSGISGYMYMYSKTNVFMWMTANMVPTRNEVGMVSLRDAVMVLGVLSNVHIHMA